MLKMGDKRSAKILKNEKKKKNYSNIVMESANIQYYEEVYMQNYPPSECTINKGKASTYSEVWISIAFKFTRVLCGQKFGKSNRRPPVL